MSQFERGSVGLLRPIQRWLDDAQISEILCNKPEEIWIEKQGVLTQVEVPAFSEEHLKRLFQLIANENRQRLSVHTPLLSGNLADGSRIQLCIPPTSEHYTFSIRRKVLRHLSLANYRSMSFLSNAQKSSAGGGSVSSLSHEDKELLKLYKNQEWDDFIVKSIGYRKNIIISGGTSSGKTTFLNACLSEIDSDERLLVLEDTREVEVPHKNVVRLLASKGSQGESNLSMQDLIQCCLRLRPDRIIMGEIRGAEILDFISACSTGHEGSLTSIHANSPSIAFMRMTQMYKLNNVPSMRDEDILKELKEVVDIIVQVKKTPNGRFAQSIYFKLGYLVDC